MKVLRLVIGTETEPDGEPSLSLTARAFVYDEQDELHRLDGYEMLEALLDPDVEIEVSFEDNGVETNGTIRTIDPMGIRSQTST